MLAQRLAGLKYRPRHGHNNVLMNPSWIVALQSGKALSLVNSSKNEFVYGLSIKEPHLVSWFHITSSSVSASQTFPSLVW